MSVQTSFLRKILSLCTVFSFFILSPVLWAQNQSGDGSSVKNNMQGMSGMKEGGCPMCGAMGWTELIIGGLVAIAIIAALISLSVFLIRRSRTQVQA